MSITKSNTSVKVHVFPIAPDYFGDHPMSDWVNLVIADQSYTDEGIRSHIVDDDVAVGVYHREDILPMIPSMARFFKDVVVHLDPIK